MCTFKFLAFKFILENYKFLTAYKVAIIPATQFSKCFLIIDNITTFKTKLLCLISNAEPEKCVYCYNNS